MAPEGHHPLAPLAPLAHPRDEREITLNRGEQVTARIMASFREGMNRFHGVKDAKKSPRSGYDIDLDGIGGEMAFAKIFNFFMDIGVFPRKGGHDFITRNDETVDVKTTPLQNGDLLVSLSKKKRPSDYYALMIGAFPTYRYAGFIEQGEVFIDSNLTDLTHGMTYLVPQSKLL